MDGSLEDNLDAIRSDLSGGLAGALDASFILATKPVRFALDSPILEVLKMENVIQNRGSSLGLSESGW